MAKQTVVLTGNKALNRKLARLRGAEAKKIIRQAARPALRPVLNQVKINAPRLSGKLAASFKVRAMPRSRKSFGAQVTTGINLFQGDTFYGGFIEWGTEHIQARRFIKAAAAATQRQAIALYRAGIRKGLLAIAKKP